MARTKVTVLATMVIVLAAACSVGADADPTGDPSSDAVGEIPSASTPQPAAPSSTSSAPTPSDPPSAPPATPVPSPPSDLERIVADEFDDIRIEVELQRNPLPAGRASWVLVTVTNEGKDDVLWLHDGCASLASIYATTVPQDMGTEQVDQAALFKTYVLGGYPARPPSAEAWFRFVPKTLLGRGSYGCADVGIGETIEPGTSRRQRLYWSGFTHLHQALPPTGPATIHIQGATFSRKSSPVQRPRHVFELEIDTWIIGSDTTARLSPAQVVDAALADATFAAYLETQEITSGRAVIAWYDVGRDIWEIGVMPWYETTPPRIHGVLVDPLTGVIVGPLDREWDKDVDPFP